MGIIHIIFVAFLIHMLILAMNNKKTAQNMTIVAFMYAIIYFISIVIIF